MTDSGQNNDVFIASKDSEQTVRSIKHPTERDHRPSKRQNKELQEDALLKKAVECMERSATADAKNTTKRDATDIFGEYVATELRPIKNEETKRQVKFRHTAVLFTPCPLFPPPCTHFQLRQCTHSGTTLTHLLLLMMDGFLEIQVVRHLRMVL